MAGQPIPKGSSAKKPKAAKKRGKGEKTKLMEKCDALFGAIIRSRGFCEGGDRPHKGNLQCAHGFSRSYRATRWDFRQCWCLCAGCHTYWTHRPIEWDLWMRERLGQDLYEEIRDLALHGRNPDMKELAEDLQRRLDVIEGRAAA